MSEPVGPLLTDPAPRMAPVSKAERIEVIDILRGWAIFGMLFVNMSDMPGKWPGTADRLTLALIGVFAAAKFYTLFSFLFGLGLVLQMRRAEARGAPFVPVYMRRLLILLLIGLAHFLLGERDILMDYAVLGFLLLLFRTSSPRTLVVAAFLITSIFLVRGAVVEGLRERRLADPQTAQQAIRENVQRRAERRALTEQNLRVYARGSFGEIVAQSAHNFVWRYSALDRRYIFPLGYVFPLFLLGLYAGRRRILENIPAHLPFIRKVMWWGLGLGLPANVVSVVRWELSNPAWPYLTSQLAELLWAVGAPALCFFYASAIILLVQRHGWKERLAPLAAVGRMALSNYLFHSLVFVFIFYSYGLGLYGKVGPLGGVVLAVPIFAVQLPLSVRWLRRFRFGPAEWLWRTLTYGNLQPMRVAAAR